MPLLALIDTTSESVGEPARYFRTNVAGTLNLLDAIRAAGVERLVFSSTAATYGEPDEVPILETAPTVPTNPYGASKLAVDLVLCSPRLRAQRTASLPSSRAPVKKSTK